MEEPVAEEQLTLLAPRIRETLERLSLPESSSMSVVSFVGFTHSGTNASMPSIANAILEKNVFDQITCCSEEKCDCIQQRAHLLISDENNNGLWMYCDNSKNTIYLLLNSLNEWEHFFNLWDRTNQATENEFEFQSWLWKQEYLYLRMLVFIFMVSHCVMLSQPISKLDSNMVSLLRIVSSVKRHILPHASSFMNMCWKTWNISSPFGASNAYSGRGATPQGSAMAPGRCVPFLLFLFQEVQLPGSTPEGNKSDIVHDKSASISIKRIKEALQARVRFLFRTCHLVQTNDLHASFDGRQLFTLPPPSSQFFVHLITRGSTGNWLSADPAHAIFKRSMLSPEKINTLELEGLLKRRRLDARGSESFEIKLLREFALGWIKWAGTGYPRNFIKRGIAASELPNAKQWVSGCIALKEFFFGQISREFLDHKSFSVVEDTLSRRLKDCMQINNRFSASHCAQILRKAIDLYLLESPTYYNKQYHEMKLENAFGFYMLSARGPCVQEFAQKLRIECQNIWERGRQRCEVESLTGHQCVLGANHHIGSKMNEIAKGAIKHRSAFQPLHACNCGTTRREREDPFELADANIKFFDFSDCCRTENNYFLKLSLPKSIPPGMWFLIRLGSSSFYHPNSGLHNWDGFVNNSNFLLPWDLSSIKNIADFLPEEMSIAKEAQEGSIEILERNFNKLVKPKARDDKTPTIFTKNPEKPKANMIDDGELGSTHWPLLHTESSAQSSSLKSPPEVEDGLEIVRAIPLDLLKIVELHNIQSESKYPNKIGDSSKEKRSRRGIKQNHKKEREKPFIFSSAVTGSKDYDLAPSFSKNEHNSLKGYLGVEYECPRGHRFISCGEGKICKLGHTGHPKENTMSLLEQDFPVFISCICNNTADSPPTISAQLQRIIIVTPDSSLLAILNPIIKDSFNPNSEISPLLNPNGEHSEFNGIALPKNSTIVLRLPYIHYDEDGKAIKQNQDNIRRLSTLYLARNFLTFNKVSAMVISKDEEAATIT